MYFGKLGLKYALSPPFMIFLVKNLTVFVNIYLLSFLARAFKNLTFKIDFKQGPRGSLVLSSMDLSVHPQEFFLLLLFFLFFWTPVTPVTTCSPRKPAHLILVNFGTTPPPVKLHQKVRRFATK